MVGEDRSSCLSSCPPASSTTFIKHLNDVVLNGHASVVFWSLPFKVAVTCCHVLDSQGTNRGTWDVQHHNLDISLIVTVDIAGSDDVHTIFLASCRAYNQLDVVFAVDNLDLFRHSDLFRVDHPLLVSRGLS